MCNRHVAHLIAEYEAARLDEAEGDSEPRDAERTARERSGLLAALGDRFAR